MRKSSNPTGAAAEEFALQFLKRQQLQLIERNFNTRFGELDLIMQDQDSLVFVEVRYRRSSLFGSSIESVTHSKQHKLKLTAQTFLSQLNAHATACRFDIVALQGDLRDPLVDWIKNAF
ncbi:MAG: YraN family protein [Pseudomonadota bacterium]